MDEVKNVEITSVPEKRIKDGSGLAITTSNGSIITVRGFPGGIGFKFDASLKEDFELSKERELILCVEDGRRITKFLLNFEAAEYLAFLLQKVLHGS